MAEHNRVARWRQRLRDESKDRQIGLGHCPQRPNITRVCDDAANVYQATSIQVGEYDQSKFYVQDMPGDIPIASKVCFGAISTKASEFTQNRHPVP